MAQIPIEIVSHIMEFVPKDSTCKSPTADLIKNEVKKQYYEEKDGFTFADHFFNSKYIYVYGLIDYYMSMQKAYNYYIIYGHGKGKIPDRKCKSLSAQCMKCALRKYKWHVEECEKTNKNTDTFIDYFFNDYYEFVYDDEN